MKNISLYFFAAILSTLSVGATAAYADTYTVVGDRELCGEGWDWDYTENDMILEDGLYVWRRINLSLTHDIAFHIGENHSDKSLAERQIILSEHGGPGTYAVSITFNAATNEVTTKVLKQEKIEYLLMGVSGNFETGIPFTWDEQWGEYVLKLQPIIQATDAVYLVMTINGEPFFRCAKVYVDSTPNTSEEVYSIVGETGSERIVIEDGLIDFTLKNINKNSKKLDDLSIHIRQSGYVRNVTNRYGTMCVRYSVIAEHIYGATFYQLVGRDADKIYLESVEELKANTPYIFEATGNQVKVVYSGGRADGLAGQKNGLIGSYDDEQVVPQWCHILKDDMICQCDSGCKIKAHRAYIVVPLVPEGKPKPVPGRKYIGLDVQSENIETDIEEIFTTDTPVKTIENGRLIIIRNGVKYNVQGQQL